MDYSTPGSSVHGTIQARILEWVATPSSRGSSQTWNQTHVYCVSCIVSRFFNSDSLNHQGSLFFFFYPRGHTPLPRQAGQVSRGHQQVGEVPPQVPGDPGLHCSGVPPTLVSETSHWIPKAGSGHSQHAHQASSAPARLPTAFRAPRTACATKQTPRGVSGQTHVCWRPPGGKLFRS